METNYIDEIYEILDEMNSRVVEIVNEHIDSDDLELIMPKISQKSQEFIYDLQDEIEKLDNLKMEV